MIANGRGLQNIRSFWIYVLLLAGSILAGADAPSLPNFFCLATMLVLLAGILLLSNQKALATILSSGPESLGNAAPVGNGWSRCLPAFSP